MTLTFSPRHHNHIKILGLLTAISLKNELKFVTRYAKNSLYIPRTGTSVSMCQRISCRNFTQILKSNLRLVWESDHPPATAVRAGLFPMHVEDPSHEEGIVRGLTFRPSSRCVSDNESGPHAADCRGVCAGVTQFVVTNEHNMIMSRGRTAIYSRTFPLC